MLQDFLWNYFSTTGDIESYLLYKDHQRTHTDEMDQENMDFQDSEQ